MSETLKQLISSMDENGLKELYHFCDMQIFEHHINNNEEYEKRYKEIWLFIGKTLRNKGIWNY